MLDGPVESHMPVISGAEEQPVRRTDPATVSPARRVVVLFIGQPFAMPAAALPTKVARVAEVSWKFTSV